MFNISFVVVTVKARLVGFDRHLEEAAMDLGANEWTTFRKVTLPLIAPAILAAALLTFALSVDDFVITYFNSGSEVDVPALRLGRRSRRRAAAGQRDRDDDLRRRARPDARQHSAPATKGIHMSAPVTGLSHEELQQSGPRPPVAPLHAHGRRTASSRGADHRPRRRLLSRGLEGQALPRRARRALLGQHRLRLRRGDRPGGARADARAAVLHELVVRAPARDRARADGRDLAPGDLNRVFFVSGGSEAVESAWKLARQHYLARDGKHGK